MPTHIHPLELRLEHVPSPIGTVLVATDAQNRLRALDWLDHEDRMRQLLRRQYRNMPEIIFYTHDEAAASSAALAVDAYFQGDFITIAKLPIATGGTEFQRKVWAELCTIAPSTTISYGELATRIGQPRAVRAVGLANGANPISIAVPCHRVIGSNQTLTGYGGGLERKRWLLAHELAHAQTAIQPSLLA